MKTPRIISVPEFGETLPLFAGLDGYSVTEAAQREALKNSAISVSAASSLSAVNKERLGGKARDALAKSSEFEPVSNKAQQLEDLTADPTVHWKAAAQIAKQMAQRSRSARRKRPTNLTSSMSLGLDSTKQRQPGQWCDAAALAQPYASDFSFDRKSAVRSKKQMGVMICRHLVAALNLERTSQNAIGSD